MLQEPVLICVGCCFETGLQEATGQGMLCSRCGGELAVANGPTLAKMSDGATNGSNPTRFRDPIDATIAEVWLPAHNESDSEVARQLASTLPAPVALEYFAAGSRRTMLLRGPRGTFENMAGKISDAWPSARIKQLDADPLSGFKDSRTNRYNITFTLQKPPYLPLGKKDGLQKSDPADGLLSAMLGLRKEEMAWLQFLVLRRRGSGWAKSTQRRLKLEVQHGFLVDELGLVDTSAQVPAHLPRPKGHSLAQGFLFLFAVLGALMIGVFLAQGFSLGAIAAGTGLVVVLGGVARLLGNEEDDPWQEADLSLVREKVVDEDSFFEVAIRASVWAGSASRGQELLQRIQGALAQYSSAGGNKLVPTEDLMEGQGAWPADIPRAKGVVLGSRELGSLWHPPVRNGKSAPSLTPVNSVEARSPDPEDVIGFYDLGKYFHADGSTGSVQINEASLERNILLVGKPGTGKTNTMTHLALAGMKQKERPAIVIIDPHGDMATQIRGTIDPDHISRVRIMDLGDEEYALTFNPLNPHREGWDVESVASAVVDIGQGLWGKFWGPRMQDVARNAFKALAAANQGRSREDLLGLSLVAGLVAAPKELQERFIKSELEGSRHQEELLRWFLGYFQRLRPYTREEVMLSLQYKAHRFQERPMLHLFSSAKSMLDIGETLREREILIINTRKSLFGADVSSFVGSLMINIILREIARQGEDSPEHRAPVMVVVDEFQTFTGVRWQEVLGETRKYGGRFVIGTQNFASLGGDEESASELRGRILGGVQPLFAFNMNGEDAHYLSRNELGGGAGGPSPQTLTNLEPYRAYVRLVRDDGSVTTPFYYETAPPPEHDETVASGIWELRGRYSLRYEEAVSSAREKLAYLDRYGRTLLTQGDTGAKDAKQEQSESSYEVQRAMLVEEGDDQARLIDERVRRALDGQEGEEEPRDPQEGPESIFDEVSEEMLDLLEAKLSPGADEEQDPEGGQS